jgi:hypothetical protein
LGGGPTVWLYCVGGGKIRVRFGQLRGTLLVWRGEPTGRTLLVDLPVDDGVLATGAEVAAGG